jgi:hypothetical protein
MDDTFESLMDEYTIPAMAFDIDCWTTGDLVALSNLIDAELQKRYAASIAQTRHD